MLKLNKYVPGLSLFLFLLLFTQVTAFSETISKNEAKLFAEKFALENWKVLDFQVQQIVSYPSESNPALYECRFKKGMVLVAADDYFSSVFAYTENFNPNKSLPDAYFMLIKSYCEQIHYALDVKEFRHIIPGQHRKDNRKVNGISPLLQTDWGQGCYYNEQCPSDTLSGSYFCHHVPTGCVATAIAQIMKYYDYPSSGSGTKSYNHPDYGTLTADFGNTTYQFATMPNLLYSTNNAVAKLMYHIGVSINMNYAATTSGAYAVDAKNALKNYFNYKSSIQHVSKVSYTDLAWKNLMINELQNGRPLFYGGVDPNVFGGHAWVVDGYNGFDHFHINWGWDGQLNGYFMLNGLTPSGNANFTIAHEAIIGIEPSNNSLKAQFTADTLVVSTNQNIQFSDLSIGNVLSWNWQFPGGTPASSVQQQPGPVSYASSGIYDIRLIVGDGQSFDTIYKEDYIVVAPYANFESSRTEIAEGNAIDFFNQSNVLGTINSYSWHFEGGSPASSNNANPQNIVYQQAGIYKVSLSIQTSNGNHISEKLQYIKVYEQCDTLYYSISSEDYVNPTDAPSFSINEYDLDGLTPYYSGVGHHSGWNIFNEVINPGDTNFFYGATSWFTSPGQADNWIVFGPLSIPSAGAEVFWEHMFWLNNKRDAYQVYISESGPHPSQINSGPIFEVWDNDPFTNNHLDWHPIKIQIDSNLYGGKQIYLVFHHFGNDMAYVFFDNIGIASCTGLPTDVIDQNNLSDGLKLFPNPVRERFAITSTTDIKRISIHDVQGKMIITKHFSGQSSIINFDLSCLEKGLYLVTITSEKGQVLRRIIKE